MHIFTIILNHCMFRTRVINHLVITSNKQFFSDRMMNYFSVFFFIICGNYFYINTTDRGKFKSTENKSAFRGSYECFCRLRKYYCRAVNISLFTIFIFKNSVFKTLKSNSISYIFTSSFSIFCTNRKNFNTSWRNVERYFCTLNYNHLSNEILFGLCGDFFTFCVYNGSGSHSLFSGDRIINSCQKVLVRTKSMSSDYPCHLTRIKREGCGSRNVDFSTNFKRRAIYCFCRFRMTVIRSRVLQNNIPAFRSRYKKLSCLFKVLCLFKLFIFTIKSYERLLSGNGHGSRSSIDLNCTIRLRLKETEFIHRKNKVTRPIHIHLILVIPFTVISCHIFLLLLFNMYYIFY